MSASWLASARVRRRPNAVRHRGGMTDSPETATEKPPVLKRIPLPDLLASQLAYTKPAFDVLETAIKAKADEGDPENAARDTVHFETIAAWCEENPRDAARIVLCSIYLGNGQFVVQGAAQPEQPAEAEATAN